MKDTLVKMAVFLGLSVSSITTMFAEENTFGSVDMDFLVKKAGRLSADTYYEEKLIELEAQLKSNRKKMEVMEETLSLNPGEV